MKRFSMILNENAIKRYTLVLFSLMIFQLGYTQKKLMDFQSLYLNSGTAKKQEANITNKRLNNGYPPSEFSQYKLNPENAIYFQDFENFAPGDMTFIDNDSLLPDTNIRPIFGEGSNWIVDIIDESGNHAGVSTSWLVNGDSTADDWMITPLIHLDPAAANPYFLIWDAGSATQFAPDGYEVMISTTGTAFADFTPIFSIEGENEYPLTTRVLNLTQLGYTGNVYIAFRHNSTNRFILMVDRIMVTEISPDMNAGLSNLYTSLFAAYGQEMHVAGVFNNYSSTNLTSLTLNWTINGFGPYEEVIDSLDIPLMASGNYTLTISKLVSATTVQVVGANEVKAWISEVNGAIYTGLTNDTATCAFELSTDYSYYMNFDWYVEGDMTMVDNDTVVPNGNPLLNNWRVVQVGPTDYAAIAVSLNAGGQVDQWMITPPIDIKNGDFLFWEIQGRGNPNEEVLEIMVSTTGQNLSDFTSLRVYHEGSDLWTLRNAELSAYAGQTVYLAFRYRSNNKRALVVNNVLVKPFAGVDLGITKLNTALYLKKDEMVMVAGVLKNELGNEISSFTLNYQVNNGNVVTESFTGVSLLSLNSFEFEMTEPLKFAEYGIYPLTVWISEANGIIDENNANDTIHSNLQVVSFLPERKLVIEEGTGTWCGWCVRGIVFMDSIYKVYPNNVIPIAVHNGDPMKVDIYTDGMISFPGFMGFPLTIIDRKFLSDPASVFDDYNACLEDFGYASLDLDVNLGANRNITANVSAEFAAALKGDFRFALVITEDNVHGTSSFYDQHNYYSGGANGPMPPFDMLPDPVPAADMYYDFVARTILGGYTGQENSLPDSIEVNSKHTYTFNYSIPAEYNIENLTAIALLIDNQTGQIMNAADFKFEVGISEITGSTIKMYPNPASKVLNVSDVRNSNIQLINMMGQVVYSSRCLHDKVQINVSNFSPGVYFVRISKGQKVETGKIVIH